MKQEVVVMNVSRYDMVVKDTGEALKGITVRYALTDNLVPYEEDNLKGYKLAKASMSYEQFSNFSVVPGVYEADLFYNVANDGTAKLAARSFEFKRAIVGPAKGDK